MLKIENLCVSYGGIKALRGISLEVPDGKIVTLIGANGAGKSTTLRTISGLVKADSGSITYDGQELLGKPINKILEAGIAQSPEGRRVFANLTVLENLKAGAYLRKDKDGIEKDIKWVYELFPRLEERNWQLAGTLSGGEQQMLAVGRALMSRPKLLMLDEPSLGLAPLVVQGIFDIIRTVNQLTHNACECISLGNFNPIAVHADCSCLLLCNRCSITHGNRTVTNHNCLSCILCNGNAIISGHKIIRHFNLIDTFIIRVNTS